MKEKKTDYEIREEMSEWERRKAVIDKYWEENVMYKWNCRKEELDIYVFVSYLWIRMKHSFD